MNVYRYKINNVTYDVFATSQTKAKAYLRALSSKNLKFIGKNPLGDVSHAVAVVVPENYITPKQASLKWYQDEYKLGNIDHETYIEAIKKWN